jgi:RNA methyltransferase, TrmH family
MVIKKITSPLNSLVKQAADIAMRRARADGAFFMAEGTHLVGAAADAAYTMREVFFTPEYGRTAEGEALLSRLGAAEPCPDVFIEVPRNVFSKIAGTETPQGILAIVASKTYTLGKLSLGSAPLVTVCDGISDPGNLGTIIRVSDAAGADAVILLPGTCDPYSPKAVRATAGSIFNIPVVSARGEELANYLNKKSIRLYAADARADEPIYEADLRSSCALVFGNESQGLSRFIREKAFGNIKIPIYGKAESLNAAVSAAVCLYEAVRQRRDSGNS